MALIDALNAVRDSLGIELDVSDIPFGTPLTARVVPDVSGLTVREIVDTPLDLDFIGKGMVFANGNLGDTTVMQTLPFTNLTTVPPSISPGVPGLLGGITGTLHIPLEIPVRVNVAWSVHRADGTALVRGTDYVAPDGLTGIDVSMLFVPLSIIELTTTSVEPVDSKIVLRATVTVRTGNTATAPRSIETGITIGGLMLPKVLVAFLHQNFGGAALVVVPAHSPLTSAGAVINIFHALQAMFRPFESLVRFAAFVAGLDLVSRALSAQPHVQFRSADKIDNLNNITLIQRSWYRNDTEAEDELTSMVLVAPPGHRVECFNSRNLESGDGKFTFRTGDMLHAAVHDLNGKNPGSVPIGNEITVDTEPPGGWFASDRFNDELSSLRF